MNHWRINPILSTCKIYELEISERVMYVLQSEMTSQCHFFIRVIESTTRFLILGSNLIWSSTHEDTQLKLPVLTLCINNKFLKKFKTPTHSTVLKELYKKKQKINYPNAYGQAVSDFKLQGFLEMFTTEYLFEAQKA